MYEQLKKRLVELRSEFEKGQIRLNELERETEGVKTTLLRISGAIQILEEEMARFDQSRDAEASFTQNQSKT